MNQIVKTRVLFSTTYTGKTPKCCKTRIGKTLPIGIAMSKYNTTTTAVKISAIAKFLDELLVKKTFYVYTGTDAHSLPMLVFESGANLVLAKTILSGINKIPEMATNTDDAEAIMIADMLYEMEIGQNEEMNDLFHSFCKSKMPLPEKEVATFCDSYFWHNTKKNHAVRYETTLTREEIEAAIRSGMLKKAAIISDLKDLTTSFDVNAITPVSFKKEKKKPKDTFLKDCQEGKLILKHKWKEEQKELIPPLSFLDDMVTNESFKKFVNKIQFRAGKVMERMQEKEYGIDDINRLNDLGKDYINVSFVGKPGTGKSHNVHAAAAACGLPIYVVNCSHNTDEDRFEGMTKIVDGKPAAIPTEAVKCFKDGGILLLEEANLIQPAVIMGALGQAVEYPFILKQDGYQDIRRHPLCIVVTTMNVGTAGTKTIAQQFANRFKQSYVMNDPEKAEFIERLVQLTGESKGLCEWIYECYDRIIESVREDNAQADVDGILNSLSLRTCVGAIENIQEGATPKEAIRDSIIGKIAEQDFEVAESCASLIEAMIDYKPGKAY